MAEDETTLLGHCYGNTLNIHKTSWRLVVVELYLSSLSSSLARLLDGDPCFILCDHVRLASQTLSGATRNGNQWWSHEKMMISSVIQLSKSQPSLLHSLLASERSKKKQESQVIVNMSWRHTSSKMIFVVHHSKMFLCMGLPRSESAFSTFPFFFLISVFYSKCQQKTNKKTAMLLWCCRLDVIFHAYCNDRRSIQSKHSWPSKFIYRVWHIAIYLSGNLISTYIRSSED